MADRLTPGRAQDFPDLLDAGPIRDPVQALLQLGGIAVTLVDILRARASQLVDVGYRSAHGLEQTKAELTVLLSALKQAESILTAVGRLNLENRLVRIEENRARAVDRIIETLIDFIPEPEQVEARRAVIKGLKELMPAPGPVVVS